jgi:hypothetical protein
MTQCGNCGTPVEGNGPCPHCQRVLPQRQKQDPYGTAIPFPAYPSASYLEEQRRNPLAVISIACSLASFPLFTNLGDAPLSALGVPRIVPAVTAVVLAIAAVVSGSVARRQIKSSGETQSGSGIALAGIIVGIVFLGVLFILILFLTPLIIFGHLCRNGC